MANLLDLKKRLDALRPFPEVALRSLRETLALEWTYHSNAIEGNTLTLKETKVVLEGVTIGGKSLREHLEAINHAEAIAWIEDIVARKEPVTERLVRELHGLVLRRIDDKNAGTYRRENVLIAGASHRPPDHLHIAEQMTALFDEYNRRANDGDDVGRAAWLHSEFVRIHPFVDGNGRTGRLLMNLELMRHGWPPAIIRKEDRLRYYEALDRAHTTADLSPFNRLIAEREEASLQLYLEILAAPSQ